MVFQNFSLIKGIIPLTKITAISLLLLMLSLSVKRVSMEKVKIHKNKAEVNIFSSQSEFEQSLANYIEDLSNKFVKEKGVFTIALSGDDLHRTMGILMASSSIDWSKCNDSMLPPPLVVPKDSPQSNYKLTYDEVLSKVPIPDDHIISINDKLSPQGASIEYESRLKQLVKNNIISTSKATGFPKLDLIILGLGYNGHMASLFPNKPQLQENTKWVTYIEDSPKPPPRRITMTFPVINSASNVVFVVAGKDKATVVDETLNGNESPTTIPAKMVSPEGELKWFLDKDAASMILNV